MGWNHAGQMPIFFILLYHPFCYFVSIILGIKTFWQHGSRIILHSPGKLYRSLHNIKEVRTSFRRNNIYGITFIFLLIFLRICWYIFLCKNCQTANEEEAQEVNLLHVSLVLMIRNSVLLR